MNTAYVPVTWQAKRLLSRLAELTNEEQALKWPMMVWLSAKVNRPAHILSNSFMSLLFATLLLSPHGLASGLSNILTFVPGVYGTYHYFSEYPSARSQGEMLDLDAAAPLLARRWMDYWVLFGTACTIETLLGVKLINALWPLWWLMKVLGLVWFLIATDGVLAEPPQKVRRPMPLPILTSTRPKPPRAVGSQPRIAFSPDFASERIADSSEEPKSPWRPSRPSTPHPRSATTETHPQSINSPRREDATEQVLTEGIADWYPPSLPPSSILLYDGPQSPSGSFSARLIMLAPAMLNPASLLPPSPPASPPKASASGANLPKISPPVAPIDSASVQGSPRHGDKPEEEDKDQLFDMYKKDLGYEVESPLRQDGIDGTDIIGDLPVMVGAEEGKPEKSNKDPKQVKE